MLDIDYDVFVVPDFKLDSNFNYDIKLVISKELDKVELFNLFTKLGIVENIYTEITSKTIYYINLSCLVDLKKWLINLNSEFRFLNIRSNLDSNLLNKLNKKLNETK